MDTNSAKHEQVIIVGAGPCGLAAAIALQEQGIKPLVIEKGNIVDAISQYPTHQMFFSTSAKLEIGDVPFIIEERKPRRNQALSYYREAVKKKQLRINAYEEVTRVQKLSDGQFLIETKNSDGSQTYTADAVVMATGYYANPNYMGVPGESLSKVYHYFKEAHPYFNQDVVIIGGKNSAVDAAMELEKAGARVTVLYRGDVYSSSVKPWILPEFEALVRHEKIAMEFNANVTAIELHHVHYEVGGKNYSIKNDFVFAMTGYRPDHALLKAAGIEIDEQTGRPRFNETSMESNVQNLFIAGVLAAGNNANEIFIENGRFHGGQIAAVLAERFSK
ncbi:YpdA family putative bacillithiol disulfide reductase [Aureibacillus halotolerans]|uniref:Thioredoxin reductase (NADPH) n=1 Tax=Aureibacillus halotolerans TaxID=1508390 RepID=A0A4R6UEM9_9BACI|nr:YpdA family putative bacillithiol disulfide reductase [Aureibacillus halotolerans]TDQ41554.1 thioredoxin reductase (NADPH) [Aureibacillus halotolerans]